MRITGGGNEIRFKLTIGSALIPVCMLTISVLSCCVDCLLVLLLVVLLVSVLAVVSWVTLIVTDQCCDGAH